MWTLRNLIESTQTVSAEINGKWVPARPYYRYRSILQRIKRAWAVFTEKVDCFTWPEGQ